MSLSFRRKGVWSGKELFLESMVRHKIIVDIKAGLMPGNLSSQNKFACTFSSKIWELLMPGSSQGEQRRKEKDNVFGHGSRAPIAITLLVQIVNNTMVLSYFEVGRIIVEEEQGGNTKAEYGKTVLADLHINYETQKKYPTRIETKKTLKDEHYQVEKMRYGKIEGKAGHAGLDKTRIIYNEFITISDIPLEAQEYIVNGKSALDWVVERYCVKTDKDSGIVNDANAWALEIEQNPRYIVELIQRIITVSLETMKIVKSLPQLEV